MRFSYHISSGLPSPQPPLRRIGEYRFTAAQCRLLWIVILICVLRALAGLHQDNLRIQVDLVILLTVWLQQLLIQQNKQTKLFGYFLVSVV
uniref:Uncharacterized protein n=1 Tax=Anguilla anguilla TaxID=7936 RepID=A0A0E9PV33_ANGAN